MGFDRRESARRYTPRDGDTLQRIAERETADGNPLTWQELARFNWGTDDPGEVDARLRDELGCRRRDADNRYVVSTDDVPRGELLIPVRYERPGLAIEQTHTLRVRRKRCPEQFLGCCSLPGVTFAFDGSFVRPAVVEHLRALETLARAHPEARVMIFGHTDAVGDDMYNKKLSERRAWSVYAFVVNDADAWEALYNHEDEAWGVPVLQEILADLGHRPGLADGDWGPETRAAARAFLGLPDDAPVENDAAFRRRLFAAYMASKHDIDLPPERFMPPRYMGCGEYNPLEATDEAHARNRRVTFFLFEPSRLPTLPCAYADLGPCGRQMVTIARRHHAPFRCSFYDSLAARCASEDRPRDTIRVRLFDTLARPIRYASYRVRCGDAPAVVRAADGDAIAEFEVGESPESCTVEWGFPDPRTPLEAVADFPYSRTIYLHAKGSVAEEAVKRRLHNLGYAVALDRPLREQCEVLQAFQRREMEGGATGELDAATVARIAEVHDRCDPAACAASPQPA